jgi:cytochrome c oxidase cbb3-type subunit III
VREILLGALVVALHVALLPAPVGAVDLAAAKSNFDMFCTKCHGPEGTGNGPAAATLATKPRDFTDCTRMKGISDEIIFRAIKEGGQSVELSKDMPAWKDGMEDDEIHDLVAFVRSLCKQ